MEGVGKTHLATAIGIAAAKKRYSTYFISCHDLIMQLRKAHNENRLEQRLKQFCKYSVLIIDEIGYLPVDRMVQKACNQNTRQLTRELIDKMTEEIYWAIEDREMIENRNKEETKVKETDLKSENRQRIIRNPGLNDLIRILLLRELLGRP